MKSKTIKSVAYNYRSFDIQNAGRSNNLQIWNTNSRWFQIFRYKGQHIVNDKGKVLDVHGAQDHENRNVILWKKHNGRNQRWKIIYVDQMKPEPKKGQLNTEFGMYVERYFFIKSHMPSGRYVDLISRNLVLKTPNGRKSQ